jgi:fructokinase
MIVCCGEALIDMLPRQTTVGEAAFAPHAGGAVFNTAIALGRLGVPARFFSGLSRDMFGDILRGALDASHVDHALCALSDRPTTLAFVSLEEGQARYAFFDEGTAGRMIGEADLPDLGADVEALHFGAISLVAEPCGSTYETLMAREAGQRVISLDPNIRPGFIVDHDTHRARMQRMMAMADIVKLSDEDLAWFGFDGRAEDAAQAWHALGVKLIVVTRGRDGAIGFANGHAVAVSGIPVTVADTVGAGDTFNAGLLAWLSRHGRLTRPALGALDRDDLEAALTLGARAAAITVSRPGANPPWQKELEA